MRVPKWALVAVCSFSFVGATAQMSPPPPARSAQMPDDLKPKGPARISGGVIAGNILTKVQPVYPPEAKAAGIGGTVVMHAIISKEGIITRLTVISGPQLLQDAAVDAVKNWTYRPYLLNGVPTEVDTTITVNFVLNRPPPPGQPDL